jgi:hypothetical protein
VEENHGKSLGQCNCIEEEGEQIPVTQSPVKPGLFDVRKFMHFLFAAEKSEWKQNKKRYGVAEL